MSRGLCSNKECAEHDGKQIINQELMIFSLLSLCSSFYHCCNLVCLDARSVLFRHPLAGAALFHVFVFGLLSQGRVRQFRLRASRAQRRTSKTLCRDQTSGPDNRPNNNGFINASKKSPKRYEKRTEGRSGLGGKLG